MRRRRFKTELPDLSGAIRWLRERGLSPKQVADILKLSSNHVNVALHRNRQREASKRIAPLLSSVDGRAANVKRAEDFFRPKGLAPQLHQPKRIRELEEQFDAFGRRAWEGIRYLSGTYELGYTLRALSRPSTVNVPLLRLQARAYYFEAETYLHAGYARSALDFGLKSFGNWEYVYQQTRDPWDMERLAKTILLISSSFTSRRDVLRARQWLDIARKAFEGADPAKQRTPDPEYLRQVASTQRNTGAIVDARQNLALAEQILCDSQDTTEAAVKDMGERVLNVIADTPEWDKSRELLQLALEQWPEGDPHRASNVNWTVACGLLVDSAIANDDALVLLENYKDLSEGFGLQSTGAFLLGLTPRLPHSLRREWEICPLLQRIQQSVAPKFSPQKIEITKSTEGHAETSVLEGAKWV